MPIASWIVATHFRPRLLQAALESIRSNTYPDGWQAEIVVARHHDDMAGSSVAAYMGAICIPTKQDTGGGKRNVALQHVTGDLVLVADDDDYQSPVRARAAIAALQNGHAISELREFRYLHLGSGSVTRWCGGGAWDRPKVVVGTARNYRRSVLTRVNGWKPLPCLIEKDIQARIVAKLPNLAKTYDLHRGDYGTQLIHETICIQHGSNVWDDRPELAKGAEMRRGDYLLWGEGTWRDASGFPPVVAERLGLT